MTIAELTEKLSALPPATKVMLWDTELYEDVPLICIDTTVGRDDAVTLLGFECDTAI